ncbi:hypothetical protein [Micromonospora sp. NPDC000668]
MLADATSADVILLIAPNYVTSYVPDASPDPLPADASGGCSALL